MTKYRETVEQKPVSVDVTETFSKQNYSVGRNMRPHVLVVLIRSIA